MELGGELQRRAENWLTSLEEGCRRLQVMVGELSLRSHEEPQDAGGASCLAGWAKNMGEDMLDIIWELEEGLDPLLESCNDWTAADGMMSICYALFAEGRDLRQKLEDRLVGDDVMEDEFSQANGAQEDKANSGISTDNNNSNKMRNNKNYNNNSNNDNNNDDDHESSAVVGIGPDNNSNNMHNNKGYNNNSNDDNNNGDDHDSSAVVGIGPDNNNTNDDGDENNNNCNDGGSGDDGGSDDDDGGGSGDGHGSSREDSIRTMGKKPQANKRVICGVMGLARWGLARWGLGLKEQSAVSPPSYLLFLHGGSFFSVCHRVGVG
ncbi:hypothetical protein CBR_g38128 [Chara braunii]|uniref:Uncharacterized protein n=1 Tax=Chara braunii TaxID=69332 RepID=A0A388LPC8_CHABU|nr:hypothetical protein CBR_g38128 [Chara braunii]|eukprot:GBG84154.1 hypothetical protein CBR_g38128 [Chara braunii]